ncbi:DUF4421 family protein [Flavobacterium rhizosphaerae]|uniref:DUF4421 family protein n=1 Tax=Flavobacterium rhizosphaerae TaxID=3163298 RepID=A0ABW8YYH5_9FLAO
MRKLIVTLLLSITGYSQTDTISTAYYKEFQDRLFLQFFVLNTSNDFTLDYTNDDIQVKLIPNRKTTMGISFNYDFISFSFGVAPSFFANNKDNGNSKMISFGVNLSPGQWMQHLDFYYQKGFTLESGSGGSVYLHELKSLKIGGSTSYFLNKNFSYAATAFQNKKQLKSAGSFAPSLLYYYTSLNGKKQEGLGSNAYFINVAIAPSYYYNWVIAKNFLLSGGAALGAGLDYTDDDEKNTSFLTMASLHLALGYNSDRFFCGINDRAFVFNHSVESAVSIDDTISYFTIFAGYRFDPPELLEKKVKQIKDKIKL